MTILGHEMKLDEAVGIVRCRLCDEMSPVSPCSNAKTCECTALSRRAFTNIATDGEWWVCTGCGYPTESWLLVALKFNQESGDE